jgi:hypothetical protein
MVNFRLLSSNPFSFLGQGTSPEYLLSRRLNGPHSRSDHFEDEINLLPIPGIKTWIVLPVA